jgi:putative transposase
LEVAAAPTEVRVLVSLRPTESLAACAGKLKGRTSRWLRTELGLQGPAPLLSKGYFAWTSGKSTAAQVQAYLDLQGEHHGYAGRRLPPIYTEEYALPPDLEGRLKPAHAWCLLRFHIVLATRQRRGLFAAREAQAVAEGWRACQGEGRFGLVKVSFVPDHVHLAVRIHPATSPADSVALLMNRAQDVIGERFTDSAVAAGLGRVWQPSAYVGAYGDLASPQVQKYLRGWQGQEEGTG